VKYLQFILFLSGIQLIANTPTLKIPADVQHLHVNIFNNHSMANDQAAQIQSNTTAHSEALSHAQQSNSFLHYFQQHLSPENFLALKQEAQMAQKNFLTYAHENKTNLAFGLLGSCYSYIWFQLLYYAYQVLKTDTWSCWQSSMPNDMLKILPEQELGKKLVMAAQEKYQKAATLHDLLTPLVSFLRDVENEVKNLEAFITLHSWLDTLRLSWFFPAQKKLLSIAQEKCDRLYFIKSVFIRWVTDYKLALNRET
jgi:hypothetical protein